MIEKEIGDFPNGAIEIREAKLYISSRVKYV